MYLVPRDRGRCFAARPKAPGGKPAGLDSRHAGGVGLETPSQGVVSRETRREQRRGPPPDGSSSDGHRLLVTRGVVTLCLYRGRDIEGTAHIARLCLPPPVLHLLESALLGRRCSSFVGTPVPGAQCRRPGRPRRRPPWRSTTVAMAVSVSTWGRKRRLTPPWPASCRPPDRRLSLSTARLSSSLGSLLGGH